jgi:hypothetical protein
MIDYVTSQPFSATTLPPIQPLRSNYVKEIIENSRRVFARERSVVEKDIIEWHAEGKDDPAKPKIAYPKKEPKPIDIRGSVEKQARERDIRDQTQPNPPRPIPRPAPPTPTPPPPKLSLESLEKKTDNQRKPDQKHVSALRDALKQVVGGKNDQAPMTNDQKNTQGRTLESKGPTPEELKKILHGE